MQSRVLLHTDDHGVALRTPQRHEAIPAMGIENKHYDPPAVPVGFLIRQWFPRLGQTLKEVRSVSERESELAAVMP
jgi:hypothetical protein